MTSRLKVMSFNIRTLMITDGRDFWIFRKDQVADLIRAYKPEVMGLQEVFTVQARDLEARLAGYKWFGPGRRDGRSRGERCPIYYNAGKVDLMKRGAFWLSEEPDQPGSLSWDSMLPRLVTWGRFKHKESGQVFYVFNTHFDHAGIIARRKSAELLSEKVEQMAADCPAIVTGDLNSTQDSEAYSTLTGRLKDAREAAQKEPEGPLYTFRTFNLDSKPIIPLDYIFVNRLVRVEDYITIDDTYGEGRRPSDHMPVMITAQLKGDCGPE